MYAAGTDSSEDNKEHELALIQDKKPVAKPTAPKRLGDAVKVEDGVVSRRVSKRKRSTISQGSDVALKKKKQDRDAQRHSPGTECREQGVAADRVLDPEGERVWAGCVKHGYSICQ